MAAIREETKKAKNKELRAVTQLYRGAPAKVEAWVETLCSSHNQKEHNNQSKVNKQPEVPESQTAWNSDNQGIKEKINQ